jgi:membrane fusion protein (multidrug efflux system)
MKLRIYWLVPLLLGAAMWGLGASEGGADGETTLDASADSAATIPVAIEAVAVETEPVVSGSISSSLSFRSVVETENAVEMYPQLSGLVEGIAAEEGDRVEAGDTLLWIDDDRLRLTVREAEANLRHLERSFERTEQMFQRKMISRQDYDDRRYSLDQARLQSKRANLELEHAVVRAPFSGVVISRRAQLGARVDPNSPLFELVRLEDRVARVFVPGQHLPTIRTDQQAQVTSDYLEGRQFAGWVKRVSPVVDPASGTFRVTVGLENSENLLRPGVSVEVQVITGIHQDAVLVPKRAVVSEGKDHYVFVVEDGTARKIKLDIGYENGASRPSPRSAGYAGHRHRPKWAEGQYPGRGRQRLICKAPTGGYLTTWMGRHIIRVQATVRRLMGNA